MIYIFSNKNRCKFFFALILLLTLFLFFRLHRKLVLVHAYVAHDPAVGHTTVTTIKGKNAFFFTTFKALLKRLIHGTI